MTVLDSGATRVTVPRESKVDIRVFGEPIGLDLYCLLSHLDPNESLGIKIDQHRGQFHDSGLCMTSRHTRRSAQGELVTFSNQELARLERTNRQQPRQTDTTMGDHANQDDLAAAMALMQQQMQQMQQTIQAQQDAAEQAALAQQEQQAQTKIDELTAKVDQLLKNNQGHVFSMEQPTTGHIQNQNQRQPQSNPHAVPATGNSQPDELKGLGMMMQQLLQGQQSASSGVTAPSEPAETPLSRVYVPKVPYPIPPKHLMDPISEEQLIGFNKMVRRLPKELAFEDALQIRPLLKFFRNCRETQEEIKVLYTKALSTPALKVLPKVDDPEKFVFPCSIAGTTFKDALCDSEKLKVVPEKEHGDKGESRLLSDEDPCTDPTKFRGVENQNGREIRTTSGTQNDHVLPPSSSHHHIKINVMEKGKKEKKHGATGKVEQERSNPSDCSEGVFQRQRFLRKQQLISGLALIIPSFSPSRLWL
ncbi:hypothetical protein IGI04_001978 [Brassica rapa subsp. trilocularis]|uniref:Retrotransposon gag domain-containing protein n=1 Tax=Brassica rapa subsp. trilocularis TaxID=1813537 RepID=A0ABQ7NWA4_BRACM|nr:hypothetical protein IGI04_001978 [Brassica rapa subsp. trilocularis]